MFFWRRPRPLVLASLASKAVEVVVIEPIKTVFLYIEAEVNEADYEELRQHLKKQGYFLHLVS